MTAVWHGNGVAMLLDSSPRTWGSREELHFRLSKALMAKEMRPILVFSGQLPRELQDRYRENGIEVTTIDYRKGVLQYFKQLRQIIKKHHIGAVHIAFFDYFSLIAWLARLNGVRCIVYHARNGGLLRARSWRKVLLRLRTRVMTYPVTRVIAVSEYLKDLLIEAGLPEKKIVVVYHGIDLRCFAPAPDARVKLVTEFAIQPSEVILVTVGDLKPIKNPQVLVEACSELSRRRVGVRLFVVGDGEMKLELIALSSALGVADRIHWLGHRADPARLLQGCDIFLLASVGEAFGLVLPEAMACCLPVVASRSGGIVEIVEDRKTGVLVPPMNVQAFADAIQSLAVDEGLRREMGLRALERARREFDVERCIDETARIYACFKQTGPSPLG
jgi:glycosyltransferase involved in cell wall biosynthesis